MSELNPVLFFSWTKGPYQAFSNFAAYGFVVGGSYWPTVEHYFQAMKFGSDSEAWYHILHAPTPKDAKRLSRLKKWTIKADWDTERHAVMDLALWLKFTTHRDLGWLLIRTGNRPLIEASPFDSYWGWGKDHKGENHMGRHLMRLREQLKDAWW